MGSCRGVVLADKSHILSFLFLFWATVCHAQGPLPVVLWDHVVPKLTLGPTYSQLYFQMTSQMHSRFWIES